jgi:hypothetical protein
VYCGYLLRLCRHDGYALPTDPSRSEATPRYGGVAAAFFAERKGKAFPLIMRAKPEEKPLKQSNLKKPTSSG